MSAKRGGGGSRSTGERIRTAFDGRARVFPQSSSGNAIAFAFLIAVLMVRPQGLFVRR